MSEEYKISILDKHCLTIDEAAIRFGIGEAALRKFIKEHEDELFIIHIGRKLLIKQDLFKKYLDEEVTVI